MGQSKKLNNQPRSLSPLVLLSGISKSFDGKEVISQLDLTINNGEFLTLLGPSGCGKTTVLRLIAGLETVDAGHIMLDNRGYHPRSRRKSLCKYRISKLRFISAYDGV